MRQRKGSAGRLAATRTSRKSGGAKKRADERGMTRRSLQSSPIKPCRDQRRSRVSAPVRQAAHPAWATQPRAWCCLGIFGTAWVYITGATSAVALHDLPRSRPAIRSIPLSTNISPPFFCPPHSCLSTPPPFLRSPRFQTRSRAPPASAHVLNSHPSSAKRPVLTATASPHKTLETAARPNLLFLSAESQSSRRRTRASVLAWVFHPRSTFLLRLGSLRTR